MQHLLVVNSSGRHTRSITRRLTAQFAQQWEATRPDARITVRDLTVSNPTPVNEAWIASAFADPGTRTPDMQAALAESETLLREIESADAIVIGAPMYNFGMPAQLKAYFDQVIRVGRSFAFDPEAAEPYQPLLADKPVTAIVSVGDGSLLPGGEMEALNFLEPHLRTLLGFIGLQSIEFVRVGYEEYQDQRLADLMSRAQALVTRLAKAA